MSDYSERTIPELRNIILDQPENDEAWWNLGERLIDTEDWKGAIVVLKQIIHRRPEFTESYLRIAHAYLQFGDPDLTILNLRIAVEKEPDNAWANRDLGAILMIIGDAREGEEYLRIALGIDSHDAYIWAYLGDLYFETDREREAQYYYYRALMLDSSLFYGWLGVGKCSHELGDYLEADNTLTTALNINSGHRDALAYMVYNKEELEDWEGLRKYAERLLELEPNRIDFYSYLGRAQYELGNSVRAEENFSKCVLESELNTRAWRGLVEVYKKTNRLTDATEALLKIVSIVEGDIHLHNELATIYQELELYEETKAQRVIITELESRTDDGERVPYREIDPSIRSHIRRLNRLGLQTYCSCSGIKEEHENRKPFRPYVTFELDLPNMAHWLFTIADMAGWSADYGPNGGDVELWLNTCEHCTDTTLARRWNDLIHRAEVVMSHLTSSPEDED